MLPFEDIQFQLVDLPAIAPEHPLPWLGTTLQAADAALLVVDVREPSVVEQVDVLRSMLARLRVTLLGAGESAASDDPFAIALPTLMLANKAEGLADPQAELQALGEMAGEMAGVRLPAIAVSAETGLGLGQVAPWLFERLEVVRVYTKVPGHAAERSRPFTLRRGQTVADVARLVHRDLGRTLRYARLWGRSGFDGQQVGPEHQVADGDVVELHT
jgi:ribosome-interacting GTPase 1